MHTYTYTHTHTHHTHTHARTHIHTYICLYKHKQLNCLSYDGAIIQLAQRTGDKLLNRTKLMYRIDRLIFIYILIC